MNLKINAFIVFSFMFCTVVFSQDPAKQEKTIYKIPTDKVKPTSHSEEKKVLAKDGDAIHSCEVNKHKAVITKKSSDGTLSKQKFEVVENKK